MSLKLTLPYEEKTFQKNYQDECLMPFDLSRLKKGEINLEIVKNVIQFLNTQSIPLGVYFDAEKVDSELKGGICSVVALEIAKTAMHFFSSDQSANVELLIDKLKATANEFQDQTKKKGADRHDKRVYNRSVQEAFNTITVDTDTKVQDVGQSKIKALASYYGLGISKSTAEIDIDSLSSEAELIKICEGLEPGVYFLRIIQAANNHKREVHGHSVIYIKHPQGRDLFVDSQLGLFELKKTKNKSKENLIYNSLQSANQLFYVSNLRFHKLEIIDQASIVNTKSNSKLELEVHDLVDFIGIRLQKLIKNIPFLNCKKDFQSFESLQEYAKELISHSDAKNIFRECPEIANFLFDIANLAEEKSHKKFADELRSNTIGFINAFSIPQMIERNLAFLTPPLTGKHPVGVVRYYVEDESRNEKDLGHPCTKSRRLEIDVHYPAICTDQEPEYKVLTVTNTISEYYNSNFCTRSQPYLPPDKGNKFPLIIVSHGFSSSHDDLPHYVEELASHGYCVVTINHPFSNDFTRHLGHSQKFIPSKKGSMSQEETDNEMINEGIIKAKDIEFVIDQIQKRKILGLHNFLDQTVNTDSIGVLGYSLGGSAAILSGGRLTDIAAVVNIDGRPIIDEKVKGMKKPCLLIAGDEKKTDEFQKASQILLETNVAFKNVVIPSAIHSAFSLASAYRTNPPMRLSKSFIEVQEKTNQLVLHFFNQHLKESK